MTDHGENCRCNLCAFARETAPTGPVPPRMEQIPAMEQTPKPDLVTAECGPRPAGPPDQCFYCQQRIGEVHKPDCVILKRRVVVRLTIEYEVDVPRSWDQHMIEFHRNESGWCADNLVGELEKIDTDCGCLCNIAKFEFVRDVPDSDGVSD